MKNKKPFKSIFRCREKKKKDDKKVIFKITYNFVGGKK